MDTPTEDEINAAIGRNMERSWIIGVRGDFVIVQSGKHGACRISQEDWPDLKLVIDTLMPGVIP